MESFNTKNITTIFIKNICDSYFFHLKIEIKRLKMILYYIKK